MRWSRRVRRDRTADGMKGWKSKVAPNAAFGLSLLLRECTHKRGPQTKSFGVSDWHQKRWRFSFSVCQCDTELLLRASQQPPSELLGLPPSFARESERAGLHIVSPAAGSELAASSHHIRIAQKACPVFAELLPELRVSYPLIIPSVHEGCR